MPHVVGVEALASGLGEIAHEGRYHAPALLVGVHLVADDLLSDVGGAGGAVHFGDEPTLRPHVEVGPDLHLGAVDAAALEVAGMVKTPIHEATACGADAVQLLRCHVVADAVAQTLDVVGF